MLGKLTNLFLNLKNRKSTTVLLLSLSSLTLISCGGGGGGGDVPAAAAPPTKVIKVVSNGNTTCSISGGLADTKGRLSCWGQIPDIIVTDAVTGKAERNYRNQDKPQLMSADANWFDVAIGLNHICGIKTVTSGDRLFCMGWNYVNQIGIARTVDANVGELIDKNFYPTMTQVGNTTSWKSLSASADHTCGIYSSSQLKCWGTNRNGVLAQPYDPAIPNKIVSPDIDNVSNVQIDKLTPPTPSTDAWLKVSTNELHTCAIKDDNTLWCWGANNFNLLGLPSTPPVAFKDIISEVTPPTTGFNVLNDFWIDITAGINHSCAISATKNNNGVINKTGRLWCWGNNSLEQLGKASPQNVSKNITLENATVVGADNWTSVAAGLFQTCAINTNNEALCFGYDAPVSFSLNNYGVAAVAGQNSDWTSITVGYSHACGTKTVANSTTGENNLYCWGQQQHSQLGSGFKYNSYIPNLISAETIPGPDPFVWKNMDTSFNHSCAVKNDGTLWCWGRNETQQLGLVKPLPNATLEQVGTATNWVNVKSNYKSTCATDTDNTLWCWGANNRKQLGDATIKFSGVPKQVTDADVTFANNIDDFSVGDYFSCAHKQTDNSLWCWGSNYFGQVGKPSSNTPSATKNQILGNWKKDKFYSGARATCAINFSNQLFCWGDNSFGRISSTLLGTVNIDAPTLMKLPTQSPMGSVWLSAQVGGNPVIPQVNRNGVIGPVVTDTAGSFICAIAGTDPSAVAGELWCWGDNALGSLGDKTHFENIDPADINTRFRATDNPVKVSIPNALTPTLWKQVSVFEDNVCAIREDNSLWCWGGFNAKGELGTGDMARAVEPKQEATKSANWVSVKAGKQHTCGLQSQDGKTDYSLWCWGGTSYERQLGDDRLVDLNPKLIQ